MYKPVVKFSILTRARYRESQFCIMYVPVDINYEIDYKIIFINKSGKV